LGFGGGGPATGRLFFLDGLSPICGYIPADKTHMSRDTILWVYIILLVAGGLVGFFKGKSRVSLIMSVAFAIVLSLCAAHIVFFPYMADVFLAALLGVFTMRVVKTKKFMPAGMLLVLTLVTLALRRLLP
jgi:uncharacterized membrane protein (UPF0136 family)